jgi:isopentenyl-diphosphate delta-isomerase
VKDPNISQRKKDHIDLAFRSRTEGPVVDKRFYYEPLLAPHPTEPLPEIDFLGKKMKAPMWISSMTGGTGPARHINQNLAKACKEFGLGMGLGSCRPLLESDEFFEDFNLRSVMGDDVPLYANLGVAQVEEMLDEGNIKGITALVDRLQADGLIIHVNPMQEWLQPEGDRFKRSSLEIIKEVLEKTDLTINVKEVGQGMGPASLKALLELPIGAIEFGAFGGTNFAKLELLRSSEAKKSYYEPISFIGHTAEEMVSFINDIVAETEVKCKQLIISGGLTSFIDGYYLMNKSTLQAVYGQASFFLKHANESYENLREFVTYQIEGLKLANSYFRTKE